MSLTVAHFQRGMSLERDLGFDRRRQRAATTEGGPCWTRLDAECGIPIYRSRLHHGLRRNFQRKTLGPAVGCTTSPD